MRRFFVLTYQGEATHLQSVVDYPLGTLESEELKRGTSFDRAVPPDFHLVVDEGQISDLLANPLSWLIVSEKLYDILERFAAEDMQVVEVPVLNHDRSKPVTAYRVINVLKVVRAVDMERSLVTELDMFGDKIPHVMKFVFKGDLIPANVHLFRPAESISDVIVSEELVAAFKGVVTGVSLIKTETV